MSLSDYAFDAGWAAYVDGVYYEDNPFDDGSQESYDWKNGWEQAEYVQSEWVVKEHESNG